MNLYVDFAGVELRNPFLIASAQYTTCIGQIKKYAHKIAEAGWAGIVTKTFSSPSLRSVEKPHKYRVYPGVWTRKDINKGNEFYVVQNTGYCVAVPFSKDVLKEDVKVAHREGVKVIASIGGNFQKIAREVDECGVDMIELNLGCPSLTVETSGGGLEVTGLEPTRTLSLIREVKKECSVPIMPKLSIHSPNPNVLALECERGGADAISSTNTVGGILGIDVETGRFISSDVRGGNYMSGLSGPFIRPIALYTIAHMARSGIKIPLCGIGGINDWRSAVEFMMVGAKTVQCGTGVMVQGFGIARDMVKGLTEFMERKGYSKINDFTGLSLGRIQDKREPQFDWRAVAMVDEEKCNGCSQCIYACLDAGGHPGSISVKKRKAIVNEDACAGCGLCAIVCPSEAIGYKEVPYTPCVCR